MGDIPTEGSSDMMIQLQSRSIEGQKIKFNPFDLFPEEVWERMLENLITSKDVMNVFEALPELQGQVLKNNYQWLFDQVIPHLYGWLSGGDVLTCRKVCKGWCHGMDSFLENHPHKKAHSLEEEQITGTLCPPRGLDDEHFLFLRESGMSKKFEDRDEFLNFDQEMTGCPAKRNPFVGRSLWLTDVHVGYFGDAQDRGEYWMEALTFLHRYGRHIWFLHVGQTIRVDYDFFCRFVFEILSLLPNLKGLKLEAFHMIPFRGSGSEARGVLEGYRQSFPNLAQLETIIWSCGRCAKPVVPECLVKFVVMTSSTTLRRLCLCPCRCRWFGEYSNPFPNLTDFTLARCTSKEGVGAILGSLDASNLNKLELQFGENLDRFLVQGDIVAWLKLFPKLQTFKLSTFIGDMATRNGGESGGWETVALPIAGTISSLKSFQIENCPYEMVFGLLECFPNLEYLKIHNMFRPNSAFLRKLHGPDLWEMLPKLKEQTLTTWQDPRLLMINADKVRFSRTRAKYEWMVKKNAERGSVQDLEGIFEGFTSMELGLWGEVQDDDGEQES